MPLLFLRRESFRYVEHHCLFFKKKVFTIAPSVLQLSHDWILVMSNDRTFVDDYF
jgi:hypothetical protein